MKDKTLKQVALPASHDAGMYLRDAQAILGKTQDLNLHDQLAVGVRYFDLRPIWNNQELYICHGPIMGPKVSEVLADIQRFFAEGHKELAILKLSHYSQFDDSDGKSLAYDKLVKAIQDTLGPWLLTNLPQGKRLGEVPLKALLADGSKVVVVCDGQFPLKQPQKGIWVYRDWEAEDAQAGDLRVFDQYANTLGFETMKKDQADKFQAWNGLCKFPTNNGAPLPCDLFLLSWTLTPPTAVWLVSKEPNRKLIAESSLLKPMAGGVGVNLIYTDYVEYSHSTDLCLLALEADSK
jgi:hypothetical protein